MRPQSSAGSGCDNCQVLASELAASKKRVDKLEERLVSGGLDHMHAVLVGCGVVVLRVNEWYRLLHINTHTHM